MFAISMSISYSFCSKHMTNQGELYMVMFTRGGKQDSRSTRLLVLICVACSLKGILDHRSDQSTEAMFLIKYFPVAVITYVRILCDHCIACMYVYPVTPPHLATVSVAYGDMNNFFNY